MRGRGNPNQEDNEYEEEGPTSAATTNYSNRNSGKDSKSIDKVSVMRSKHSVTEQRRRSKINERFQVLRDLIPHSDQKRDTASFLLEVIEYVQFLQEKVQKCEGSYQGWNPELSKLMPWRNSHWRGHGFVGNVRAVTNGSGPGSVFSGKLDEDNHNITPSMQTSKHNPVESDPSRDIPVQSDLRNRGTAQSQNFVTNPLQRPVPDVQSAEYPITSDPLVQPEELIIEGGTISITSTYSEGLLSTLTQALQNASVDLSHANISVQIDVGNRVNKGLVYRSSATTDSLNHGSMHLGDLSNGEDSDPTQKRPKM